MTDLKISLQPKQKLFLHSVENYPNTFYGGAKGGGKSKGLRSILLLRRFKYPGSHGAIFRRTYPELEGNHIRPLFEDYPFLREYWNDSKKLLTLPNGSSLQFCHCNNEVDVDLYQGREFHDLAIDEAGQWTEAMFRKLQGSNRSSKPGIKARTILTGNPGGIGHGWLKRLFIEQKYNEREIASDYNFIQALVHDNKALIENDPAYLMRLESEPNEALRKAYRFGDRDIFAGQFFSEIRREKHVIKPFTIPDHWRRFGAYDFGFAHPGAFGWFANDEDGNVYLYRIFLKNQLRIDQFATEINKHQDTKKLMPIVAGHDCFAKKAPLNERTPPTIAEEFAAHHIRLKKANIERITGAQQVRNYLAWEKKETGPKFKIFETCMDAYECLAKMQHDPDRLEDVLKVDATEGDILAGDDLYDMIRMGLMSRPILTDALPKVFKWGSPEWHAEQVRLMEEKAVEFFTKEEEANKAFGIY